MKIFQTIGTAILLAAAVVLPAADPETELRMGDDAFASGELESAMAEMGL